MADFITPTSVTGMRMDPHKTRAYKQRRYSFFTWTIPSIIEGVEDVSYNVIARSDLIKVVFPDGTEIGGTPEVMGGLDFTKLLVSATMTYSQYCYYDASNVTFTLEGDGCVNTEF